ncbi:MAG: hypothetical protein ABUL41_00530, partial [Chitinophagaceae bacterium]
LSACNKNNDSDSWKTVETFTFTNNKRIDTARNNTYFFVQVNPGNNIVFEYDYQKTAPSNIADGDLYQHLYFEIPSTATTFTYSDAALANASCYFLRSCFCGDVGTKPVTSGTIHGVKRSATKWTINVDLLMTSANERITFQKDFILSN